MTTRVLAATVTLGGYSVSPVSVEVQQDYSTPCARCKIVVETMNSAIVVNDAMDVTIGYSGDTTQVFTGNIDVISYQNPAGLISIEGRDVLKRAQDFLMVPAGSAQDPVKSYANTDATDIVEDLLDECGLTDYSGDTSNFIFGTIYPAEFYIMTVADAITMINNIIVWHCWAKPDGQVRFADIKPVAGSSSYTFKEGEPSAGGNLTYLNYSQSDDGLRNKVVVFGKTDDDGNTIRAEASASSPYVPSGYYRTAVVSNQLIDLQSMAQDAANYNLTAWNRLDEAVEVQAEGVSSITCRDTVTVQETFTGLSTDFFVFSLTHLWGPDDYMLRMRLVK